MSLIKNNRFFIPPPDDESDFKVVFHQMARVGAGRPVDDKGIPEGPWTAELLADAISRIDANRSGVELRTVQRWFQYNDTGISSENIRWLARIFGCGDADAISSWQVALSAAQARLTAKRRKLKENSSTDITIPLAEDQNAASGGHQDRPGLANRSEALFSGAGSLNLPVAIWAFGGLLWLLVYIVGVHRITYSPIEGLNKQVGFLWAPSWTVDRMVFIPLFVIAVTGLLDFWKNEQHSLSALQEIEPIDQDRWSRKVASFSFSFWAISIVCLVIVFFVQWTGVYLRPLIKGTINGSMVDWILVAIVRSDVVTIAEAIVLSGLANFYSALAYWCYFCGLLLLYSITNDFYENYRDATLGLNEQQQRNAVKVGTKIARGVFRCTIFGILSATCIKLNAVYLISDTENILAWLLNDALAVMGLRTGEWGWLMHAPSAFMTSFFVLFITCFIFFICLAQVYRILEQFSATTAVLGSDDPQKVESLVSAAQASWLKMIGVVALLTVNFLLIGQFTGFSILLTGSILMATYSVINQKGSSI